MPSSNPWKFKNIYRKKESKGTDAHRVGVVLWVGEGVCGRGDVSFSSFLFWGGPRPGGVGPKGCIFVELGLE